MCAAVTDNVLGTNGSNNTRTPPHVFSADQWKALASVFDNMTLSDERLNGKFNEKLWIIDTGASNHVIGDISFLFDIKEIIECSVGLPNGQKVIATKEESVRSSKTITLKSQKLIST